MIIRPSSEDIHLTASNEVGVVYLARAAEGLAHFEAFAKSYRKFPAGHPHDLIVLCKGLAKPGELAGTASIFEGIPHKIAHIDDDGFDIHAYLKISGASNYKYMCFLNTYTEFRSVNWLSKLYAQMTRSGVGIVGMTASYESLYDSIRFISKAIWLAAQAHVRYDVNLARQFSSQLALNAPRWMRPSLSTKRRIRRAISDVLRNRPRHGPHLDAKFAVHWEALIAPGGPLAFVREFPRFPNPHIRSNGFMMSREVLVGLGYEIDNTKEACAKFESGFDGLTRQLRKKGLRPLLVGADGAGYEVEEWPASKSFRLDQQQNVMGVDNQVRAFAAFSEAERELHERITWGDYLKAATNRFVSLGCEFQRGALQDYRLGGGVRSSLRKHLRFSIVIPTRNRLHLLRQAVETVHRQDYSEREAIIFDNASVEPVDNFVKSFGDSRFKSERSAEPLSVTDSWNRAIDLATGDYVTLIGDDDGLAPFFFERAAELIDRFERPDVIYSAFYQFMHPGVAPWQRAGYLARVRNGFFFEGKLDPFVLDDEAARKAVVGSLELRRNFTFNMQAFTFSASFLKRLRSSGVVFHSPFPDYYLANVAMKLADRIVIDPNPSTIAGVSKASFGYTLFNNLEEQGAELLQSNVTEDPVFEKYQHNILPGPRYNTNYIVTMAHVAERLGDKSPRLPDWGRYRRLQIYTHLNSAWGAQSQPWVAGADGFWTKLSLPERGWAVGVNAILSNRKKIGRRLMSRFEKAILPYAYHPIVESKNIGDFVTTTDVFEAVRRNGI